jgi:protein-tyrosine phosphatase
MLSWNISLLLLLVVSCATPNREASLVSPIPSSVPGTRVSNVHLVDKDQGRVYRGMRIRNKEDATNLQQVIGMTDVLIFRAASTGVGVDEELQILAELGLSKSSVTHIPFEWKQFPSFKVACQQSLEALRLMRESVKTAGKSLYLHCTVGEDRTGYIAALYNMIYLGWSEDRAFKEEMCARGYADGNPIKPAEVSEIIHSAVTPVFLKMSHLARTQPQRMKAFDATLCAADPLETPTGFAKSFAVHLAERRCQVK